MSEQQNLAIVIVTYKRQELLQTLFDSLSVLKRKPQMIIVIDNENSDTTHQLTENLQSIFSGKQPDLCSNSHSKNGKNDDKNEGLTEVHYIPMMENTGGSGGFSKGVEVAYTLGAEWIWTMDDDVRIFPESIDKLQIWLKKSVAADNRAIQVRRQNFDGTDFYWQYDFKNHLGIPNPISPSTISSDEHSRNINTICFEGGLFHRSLIEEIGFPDARFFIYWDDTVYGYLASKYTQPILINEFLLARTRPLDNIKIGNVRRLNSTSDTTRYYIMRNRGHMAHYFQLYGDYNSIIFALGTLLTIAKEIIRLIMADHFWKGLKILLRGMSDGKKIRKDKEWQPAPKLK